MDDNFFKFLSNTKQMIKNTCIYSDISIYSKVAVVNKNYLFALDKRHYLIRIKNGITDVLNEKGIMGLYRVGEKIFFREEGKIHTVIYDINSDEITSWEYIAGPLNQVYEKMRSEMLFILNVENNIFFGLVDTRTGKILNRIYIQDHLKKAMLTENKIFAIVQNRKDFLRCYSSEGNLCWEKKLQELLASEDTNQTGNLIFSNGNLYVVLESAFERKKATYVIDVETGKVLNQFDSLVGSYHIADGIVFNAYRYSVDRIDTRTNTLIHDNFEDILKPEKLWIHGSTSILTKDELLYFYDGATIGGNRVGVLDLKSHKLIWQTKLKIKSTYRSIRSMQLHDDVLYVHADDDTLHIFEKK